MKISASESALPVQFDRGRIIACCFGRPCGRDSHAGPALAGAFIDKPLAACTDDVASTSAGNARPRTQWLTDTHGRAISSAT